LKHGKLSVPARPHGSPPAWGAWIETSGYVALEERRCRAVVFCLGAYTGAVPPAELRRITVDYTIEFARVFHDSSPDAAFSFLSGSGADPTERSRILFARFKGEAENASFAAGFPRVCIFRPAYIYPVEPAEGTEFQLSLAALFPNCGANPRNLVCVGEQPDSQSPS
jgi:hypothetical protein